MLQCVFFIAIKNCPLAILSSVFFGGAEKMSRELPEIGISEIYIFLIKNF